jgi:hypothetical protein
MATPRTRSWRVFATASTIASTSAPSDFWDIFDLEQVTPHLGRAFRRANRGGTPGIDDLYEAEG